MTILLMLSSLSSHSNAAGRWNRLLRASRARSMSRESSSAECSKRATALRSSHTGPSASELFVQAQRSSAFIDSKPQLVQKSAAEIFLDLCDAKAKSLGVNREAFFKQYPEQYRRYGELVTGDY
jgi:hypothetical protein